MKRIHVAAAVIRGADGRILIAKRADTQHQGGLWEFPGGKVEASETVREALVRELQEELAISVIKAQPLIQVQHDYPDKHVLLDVWEVREFSGELHGAEGQPLAWVSARQLPEYEFPQANQPIVAAARLPEQYLITPQDLSASELLNGIHRAVSQGAGLLQLRAPAMFDPEYRTLALDAIGLCAGRAQVMLKGPLEWLSDFPAAGWHLTSKQLTELAGGERPIPASRWLAASCHSLAELEMAAQLGVDFVTLSPLAATQTHPEAQPLGWTLCEQWIKQTNLPVFLLGGVGPDDAAQARNMGAQGVAGIRAFWPVAL